jgi:hypothetical protein
MKYPHISKVVAAVAFLSLVGCGAGTPGADDAPRGIPRAPFDTSSRSGKALAMQLLPKHRSASQLLAPITDTTLLERYDGIPPGRVAAGSELFELDTKSQAEVAKLVDTRVIGPTTLVLDDTGYAVPHLARMMKAPSLGVVGTVHFGWNPHQPPHRRAGQSAEQVEQMMDVNLAALADQVQTFGDVIEAQQADAARRMATVVYIALNGGRYQNLRTEGWPSARDYMVFGLTRAVVLIERGKVLEYGDAGMAADLVGYVRSLREGGMPVQVVGM